MIVDIRKYYAFAIVKAFLFSSVHDELESYFTKKDLDAARLHSQKFMSVHGQIWCMYWNRKMEEEAALLHEGYMINLRINPYIGEIHMAAGFEHAEKFSAVHHELSKYHDMRRAFAHGEKFRHVHCQLWNLYNADDMSEFWEEDSEGKMEMLETNRDPFSDSESEMEDYESFVSSLRPKKMDFSHISESPIPFPDVDSDSDTESVTETDSDSDTESDTTSSTESLDSDTIRTLQRETFKLMALLIDKANFIGFVLGYLRCDSDRVTFNRWCFDFVDFHLPIWGEDEVARLCFVLSHGWFILTEICDAYFPESWSRSLYQWMNPPFIGPIVEEPLDCRIVAI